MTNLGFEHNGEYAGSFKEFPVLEHESSNEDCTITICNAAKSLGTEIYFELNPGNYQMVISFKQIPKNITYFLDIKGISNHTKESIMQIIEKIKQKFKEDTK